MTESSEKRYNTNGRVFTCGDIHGCYDELMAALNNVNFDRDTDLLIALGDIVDKGPKSVEVVRLLREPWFTSVKGNHELSMERVFYGDGSHVASYTKWGGQWFVNLDSSLQQEMIELVKDLPIAITLTTRSGRKIGLVHADVPHDDWDAFIATIDDPRVCSHATSSRDRFRSLIRNDESGSIDRVDHVYFGHSMVTVPLSFFNYSYIDTGCFLTGRLTLTELT